jgi:hypothetical protein
MLKEIERKLTLIENTDYINRSISLDHMRIRENNRK